MRLGQIRTIKKIMVLAEGDSAENITAGDRALAQVRRQGIHGLSKSSWGPCLPEPDDRPLREGEIGPPYWLSPPLGAFR